MMTDWIVLQTGRTRDSDPTTANEFESTMLRLALVDPTQKDHSILRFDHMGLQAIVVRKGSNAHASVTT